jgi:putative transposase
MNSRILSSVRFPFSSNLACAFPIITPGRLTGACRERPSSGADDTGRALRYESHRYPQEPLRMRLRELAAVRVRFGYRRLTVLLKREGWPVNAKRIYRLYTEEGLTVRTKQRKKAASHPRVPLGLATRPNER